MNVKLLVDGQPVETNPYVELVFSRIVDALIGTLRGVEEWKTVRLDVEK
jgi:hypothetical protein